MCGRDDPSSLGLLNLTWVWAIGFLPMFSGLLVAAAVWCPVGCLFLPLWPFSTAPSDILVDVFGSSLSGSGLVALVFATGLPGWLLWARLVLASCLCLPRCGRSQASSFASLCLFPYFGVGFAGTSFV